MREKRITPANLLVITFTKNAANEMIDRLILASKNAEEYRYIMNNPKIGLAEKNKYREEIQKEALVGFLIFLLVPSIVSVIMYFANME